MFTKRVYKLPKQQKSKTYCTEEFKKLQMKWYKKLDKSGFDDVERSGKNKQTSFDEYGGELKKPLANIKKKLAHSLIDHYLNLGNFSQSPQCVSILRPKLLKKPKIGDLSDSTDQITTILQPTTDYLVIDSNQDYILALVIEEIELSNIDRCILRKTSEGYTIRQLSKHLRSYYSWRLDDNTKRVGAPGQAYSTFYVQSRLKKLTQLMKFHEKYEQYFHRLRRLIS